MPRDRHRRRLDWPDHRLLPRRQARYVVTRYAPYVILAAGCALLCLAAVSVWGLIVLHAQGVIA